MIRPVILALALLPAAATAQVVSECDGWMALARNIAEPWEDNTATFANGAVRIAVLDAIEPGAMPLHLMVLTPPWDELGGRVCRIVSHSAGGIGFNALTLAGMERAYDPATGLSLTLRAAIWDGDTGAPRPVRLSVSINQATGRVSAALK